jgi:hypothetical protein
MSPESPTETAPTRAADARKQKRRARWFIAALILVPLAVLAVFLYSLTLDEPPPDVSDLVKPPSNYDPTTPGFLEAIAQTKPLYPSGLLKKYLNEVEEMEWNEKWHPHVARELFQAADANNLWPALAKALTTQDNPTGWGKTPDYDQNYYWVALAEFIQLYSFHKLRENHAVDALPASIRIMELGRKIEMSASSLVDLGRAQQIKHMGIETMEIVLRAYNGFPKERLMQPIMALNSLQPSEKALFVAFRGDISIAANHKFYALPYLENIWIKGPNENIISTITYKPNHTLRLLAESIQEHSNCLADNSETYNYKFFPVLSKFDEHHAIRKPFDIVNKDGFYVIRRINERCIIRSLTYYLTKSLFSTAQAALAIRAYKLDHGDLPESLDALVPDYLPSVPIDYMDGRPIRYSKAEHAIWTIGLGGNPLAAPLPPAPASRNDSINSEYLIFRLDRIPPPSAEPPQPADRPKQSVTQ